MLVASPALRHVLFQKRRPLVNFIDRAEDVSSLTTYNFTISGGNVGRYQKRMLAVGAIGIRASGTPASISSVTIGGNTAARVGLDQTSDALISGLFRADGTFGKDSIPIAVTFGQAQNRAAVALWEVFNLDSQTPFDAGFANTIDPVTDTVNTVPGAVIIGVATSQSATSTWTWTGGVITENFDAIVESAQSFSGACGYALEHSTALTITADPNPSGTSNRNMFNVGVWI